LEEDASSTAQGRKKQSFSAKKHGFEAAGTFNIIMDAGCEGNNAPRIDADATVVQFLLNDGTTRMNKGHSITSEALEYESLAPKKPDAKAFCKGNIYFGTKGRTKECIFLAQ